jgi:hypothetical protein
MKLVAKFSMLAVLAGAFLTLSAPPVHADVCIDACYRAFTRCTRTHTDSYCTMQWSDCVDGCNP